VKPTSEPPGRRPTVGIESFHVQAQSRAPQAEVARLVHLDKTAGAARLEARAGKAAS